LPADASPADFGADLRRRALGDDVAAQAARAGAKLYNEAILVTAIGSIGERRIWLIEASDEDAEGFCVNAVNLGSQIVMAQPKDGLRAKLRERGYTVTGIDLSPFIMAGGGAYCMTLRLDRVREVAQQARRAAS